INTQGIQEWVVPATGTYSIRSVGATSGNQNELTTSVGHPADMYGEFNLVAGQTLKILVGQHGFLGSTRPGWGGGGGSFVAFLDNTPLIIAGGSGASHTTFGTTQNNYLNAGLTPQALLNNGTFGGWADGC